MFRFEQFVCTLEESVATTPLSADVVHTELNKVIVDPDFVVDCLQLGLTGHTFGRTQLFQDPLSRYSLWLFYWRPNDISPPHRHLNWGITGVLHNELLVKLYPDHAAGRGSWIDQEPTKTVRATAGGVGRLDPPCVHAAGNPTGEPTITLNVYGPLDRLPDTEWFDDVEIIPDSPDMPLREWATACAACHLTTARARQLLAALASRYEIRAWPGMRGPKLVSDTTPVAQ
jgi:predicted metal-dependent enzyme (double-stranded beta helix superfamily)